MRVIVSTSTSSFSVPAELELSSGVLIYESGEISHVLFEKQFNKKIEVVANVEVKSVPEVAATAERSEQAQSKKPRAKSKQ